MQDHHSYMSRNCSTEREVKMTDKISHVVIKELHGAYMFKPSCYVRTIRVEGECVGLHAVELRDSEIIFSSTSGGVYIVGSYTSIVRLCKGNNSVACFTVGVNSKIFAEDCNQLKYIYHLDRILPMRKQLPDFDRGYIVNECKCGGCKWKDNDVQ